MTWTRMSVMAGKAFYFLHKLIRKGLRRSICSLVGSLFDKYRRENDLSLKGLMLSRASLCLAKKKKSACCSRNGKRWTWNKHHKTMFSQLNENQPRRISGTQAQKTRYKEISLLCLKIPTLSRSFSVCLSNDLLGFVLFFLNLITHHHHHIKRPSSLSSQMPLLKVESGPCLICFEVTCGPRGKKP